MEKPKDSGRATGTGGVHRRSRLAIALFAACVLAVMGLANVAIATHGSDGTLSACYDRRTGSVRLIKEPRLPTRCPPGMKSFTFSIQGPQGLQGLTGPTGPAGAPSSAGVAGPPGSPGTNGHTILHGAGAPASLLGTDGDFYLDDAAFELYGPKVGGAWPAGATSLIGAAGADGTDGVDGADGNTILSGAGAPAARVGVNGDFYLDIAAWALYGPKAAGAWPGTGTSLVGPAGPGEEPVYIQVSDSAAQSVAVANTLQDVTWSTTGVADGFVHVPGTAQVLVPRAGVYRITASLPMQRSGGLLGTAATGTACLAVNGVTVVCQSAGFDANNLVQGVPLTALASLAQGDVITIRVKATSTDVQVAGAANSTSVMTIASVD